MLPLMVTTLGGLFLLFVFMRRRRGNENAAPGELAMAGAAAVATAPTKPAIAAVPAAIPKATSKPPKASAAKPAAVKAAAAPVKAAPVPKVAAAAAISPLLAAKPKTDPKADHKKAAAAKKSDAKAAAKAPGKGSERFRIGYRSVRLGDGPDEFRSTELGRLDRGDEVEILGSHEGFLQVRTLAGLTGWIPRHTITGSPITSS
jgi:hypothetical protein